MNVLFSVALLKINLLALLTNHNTEQHTLNISVTAERNLLASIVGTLWAGENCGVVYDKFRHLMFIMACTSACVVGNTAICVK